MIPASRSSMFVLEPRLSFEAMITRADSPRQIRELWKIMEDRSTRARWDVSIRADESALNANATKRDDL